MSRATLITICLLIVGLNCGFLQGAQPNQSCNWRGFKECPIDSSGSKPVCDSTVPAQISPGVFAMKICTSQTPKAVGGNYDVGVAVFGTILTVDVIPQGTEDNNVHCSDGSGSVGTRVFYAHCQISGPGKIRGYWAITYRPAGQSDSDKTDLIQSQ